MILLSADGTTEIPTALIDGPLFAGVVDRERRDFLSRLGAERHGPSVTLFKERDPGDSMRIVLQGSVSLTCRSDSGERVELDRTRALDVFGEASIISPGPRASMAVTLEPTELLVLPRKDFRAMLDERHPAAESLLRYITLRICRRLRQIDARIALVHDALRGDSAARLRGRIAELNNLGNYA